jgi:hypothetical protein
MYLALLALLVPALAAPQRLDARMPITECTYYPVGQPGHAPAWQFCDALFAQMDSGNSIAGMRSWCVGDDAQGRCCVSWNRDCSERSFADVRNHALGVRDSCGSGSGARIDADPCFGNVCLSNRPDGC